MPRDSGIMPFVWFALACVLVGACACVVEGCAQASAGVRPAALGAEIERCRATSSTCEGYVACRHAAERRYGRPETGRCVP